MNQNHHMKRIRGRFFFTITVNGRRIIKTLKTANEEVARHRRDTMLDDLEKHGVPVGKDGDRRVRFRCMLVAHYGVVVGTVRQAAELHGRSSVSVYIDAKRKRNGWSYTGKKG